MLRSAVRGPTVALADGPIAHVAVTQLAVLRLGSNTEQDGHAVLSSVREVLKGNSACVTCQSDIVLVVTGRSVWSPRSALIFNGDRLSLGRWQLSARGAVAVHACVEQLALSAQKRARETVCAGAAHRSHWRTAVRLAPLILIRR